MLGIYALSGCSQRSAFESSVVGKVTLDDKPVPQGAIVLIDQTGKLATSALEPDGGYSLRCSPGTYHIAISPPPPADPFAPKSAETQLDVVKIPSKYRDVGTSGLTIDVKEGENTLDVQLVAAPQRR
ncbi:hypothetical protein M4951_02655 [Blastopirellula sp. J2-11]|uniref:hypothetical protein n=1 Tax=Blastopirellula sp. J2-11 TaxID=2943192 RepID=UPI0021C674F1|nr:hypothetical protein [Blastopirellula sp. J2-11]UUO07220.1 hypothetical protein M4951_02655 [Blastopirellula sp. J2-11]